MQETVKIAIITKSKYTSAISKANIEEKMKQHLRKMRNACIKRVDASNAHKATENEITKLSKLFEYVNMMCDMSYILCTIHMGV